MPTEEKVKEVAELEDRIKRAAIAISTDYRGLTVTEMTELRRKLREAGVEYRVVKNTLASIAAKNAGKDGLIKLLEGPTAIAFGYKDLTSPVKALTDYIRAARSALKIRGAIMDQEVLSEAQVQTLATLPPREVLLSRVMGGIKGPLYSLAFALASQQQKLLYVLSQRAKQMPQQETAPAAQS